MCTAWSVLWGGGAPPFSVLSLVSAIGSRLGKSLSQLRVSGHRGLLRVAYKGNVSCILSIRRRPIQKGYGLFPEFRHFLFPLPLFLFFSFLSTSSFQINFTVASLRTLPPLDCKKKHILVQNRVKRTAFSDQNYFFY